MVDINDMVEKAKDAIGGDAKDLGEKIDKIADAIKDKTPDQIDEVVDKVKDAVKDVIDRDKK